MSKYRALPPIVEAITFGELVLHGARECEKAGHALGQNAMPLSFTYAGRSVTHENDDCYLIGTGAGIVRMGRDDMLVTTGSGEIRAIKTELFLSTHEPAGA